MNEHMKEHLVGVRQSLIASVRELAPHRVREIQELGIARSKNTPVKVLIRTMADEIRRISRVEEIGPVRPVGSGDGTETPHTRGTFHSAEELLSGKKSLQELEAFRELMLEHIHRFLAMPQFKEESSVVVGFRLLVEATEARIRLAEFIQREEPTHIQAEA